MKKDIAYYQGLISKAKTAAKKYREECADIRRIITLDKRFNILFSNTQLLKAHLTTNDPKPVIRTRFPKQVDSEPQRQLARVAGEIAERAAVHARDSFDFKGAADDAADKAVLFGRGVLRIKYEPEIEVSPEGAEKIGAQSINIESMGYDEFLCQNVKKWEKAGWVAFRHLMTKDNLREQFGEEYAESIPLNFKEEKEDKKEESKDKESFAEVWEIWDKTEKRVLFIAAGFKEIITEQEDPYGLKNFFPMPKPLQFFEGGDLRPVPEFRLYSKIVKALEIICRRIDGLVDNIRSAALAAGADKDIIAKLSSSAENSVITVTDNLGRLLSQGGISSMIMEYPNEGKIKVLSTLESEKVQRLNEIYEITGIADIMRGQSDPSDTARAQEIKGKFGSLRLQARQSKVQEMIKGCFKIITELICEHYTPENLMAASSITLPTEAEKASAAAMQGVDPAAGGILKQPSLESVMSTLRNELLRDYTIEVESTATVFEDDQKNKGERLDLFKSVSGMLREMMPFMQGNPEFISSIKAQILFTIDAFPQSRVLKEAFEESFAQWESRIKTPSPQQPSAEMVLAQAEDKKANAEMAVAQARMLEAQAKAAQAGVELDIGKGYLIKDIQKDQADIAAKAAELKGKQEKNRADFMLKIQKERY